MLDALRRLFVVGSRPIDIAMLVIEVFVLLLIGGEQLMHGLHNFRIHRRVKVLRMRLAEGQVLRRDVLKHGEQGIGDWKIVAEKWIKDTTDTLEGYSGAAFASFLHASGNPTAASLLVPRQARDTYQSLQECLNNLLGIIEKPEVYL